MESKQSRESTPASRAASRPRILSLCPEGEDVPDTSDTSFRSTSYTYTAKDVIFPPTPSSATGRMSIQCKKSEELKHMKRKNSASHDDDDDEDEISLTRQSKLRRVAASMLGTSFTENLADFFSRAVAPIYAKQEEQESDIRYLRETQDARCSEFEGRLLTLREDTKECTDKHEQHSQSFVDIGKRVQKVEQDTSTINGLRERTTEHTKMLEELEQSLNSKATSEDVGNHTNKNNERMANFTSQQTKLETLVQDHIAQLKETTTKAEVSKLFVDERSATQTAILTSSAELDRKLKVVEDIGVQTAEDLKSDFTLKMGKHQIDVDDKINKGIDNYRASIPRLQTDVTELQSTTVQHEKQLLELSKARFLCTENVDRVKELEADHNKLSAIVEKCQSDIIQCIENVKRRVDTLQKSLDEHSMQTSPQTSESLTRLTTLEEAVLRGGDPRSSTTKSPAPSSSPVCPPYENWNWAFKAAQLHVDALKHHHDQYKSLRSQNKTHEQQIQDLIKTSEGSQTNLGERIAKMQVELEEKFENRMTKLQEQHDAEKTTMTARVDQAYAALQAIAVTIGALKTDKQLVAPRKDSAAEYHRRQSVQELYPQLDKRLDEISSRVLANKVLTTARLDKVERIINEDGQRISQLDEDLERRFETVVTVVQDESKRNRANWEQALIAFQTETKAQMDEAKDGLSAFRESLDLRINERAAAFEKKTYNVLDMVDQRTTDLEDRADATKTATEVSSVALEAINKRVTDLASSHESNEKVVETSSAVLGVLDKRVTELESADKATSINFREPLAATIDFKQLCFNVDNLISNRQTNDIAIRNLLRHVENIKPLETKVDELSNVQSMLANAQHGYVTNERLSGHEQWLHNQIGIEVDKLVKYMDLNANQRCYDRVETVKEDVKTVQQDVREVKQTTLGLIEKHNMLVGNFIKRTIPQAPVAYPSPTPVNSTIESNPPQKSAIAQPFPGFIPPGGPPQRNNSTSVQSEVASRPQQVLQQYPQQSQPQSQQQVPQQLPQQSRPPVPQQITHVPQSPQSSNIIDAGLVPKIPSSTTYTPSTRPQNSIPEVPTHKRNSSSGRARTSSCSCHQAPTTQ
ncbi:Nn.00g094390.m01.CDS01 [Neocucurbitaria sp. VM-36]